MRGNPKARHTFLMLAGVYLLYLGWQLFKASTSGEAKGPVFPIAAAVFFIVGIWIIVNNIRQIMLLSKEEEAADSENDVPEQKDEPSEDPEETPAPAAGKSLFDRAGLGAVSDEEPEDTED